MFDKNPEYEKYTRSHYTFAEELYLEYINMRKATRKLEDLKYDYKSDDFIKSKEGKEGFIAGVYTMLSLISDL